MDILEFLMATLSTRFLVTRNGARRGSNLTSDISMVKGIRSGQRPPLQAQQAKCLKDFDGAGTRRPLYHTKLSSSLQKSTLAWWPFENRSKG